MPTASQILSVWEQARTQTHAQRALNLLALAVPTQSAAELTRYSVGRRDRELLGLRERLFGSRLIATTQCPVCREHVEANFAAADISMTAEPSADLFHTFESGGYGLRFRLPECGDLASLDSSTAGLDPRINLLERCVAEARVNGGDVAVHQLPTEVVSALSVKMAELDPQGDVQLALNCPACHHHWTAPFDVVSFLWTEIECWANRLLREVHVLASAYGWRESDILALSDARRRAYLEILQS
jgi:hypothetical protein